MLLNNLLQIPFEERDTQLKSTLQPTWQFYIYSDISRTSVVFLLKN